MGLDRARTRVILCDMRILLSLTLALVMSVVQSAGAACPDPADVKEELQALIAQAQQAKRFSEGQRLSGTMWEILLRAPDETAQAALDAGMRRREVADYLGALEHFDRLVAYCPTYAEGYNQRAFVNFLQGAHEEALVDLDVALDLQPLHVAAQAGRALTLMNLGRIAEAREQMLIAVGNNPWLSERALLSDGAPLAVPGKDL
ncbi:hypothetical protein AB2B41_07270 [Marimonas sp. MJW-29]|uniref:Tetratricopeptide repeat protein n=1 Tax=Sulfitobacter sediminis TaxID=3234186 RepID=A0ABV3RLC1_9RHOB